MCIMGFMLFELVLCALLSVLQDYPQRIRM